MNLKYETVIKTWIKHRESKFTIQTKQKLVAIKLMRI